LKNELLLAVTQLAAERNLPHKIVVGAVEAALASAYKRDPAAGGQDVLVSINPDSGDVTVKTVRHIVEVVEEPGSQLTVEEARKIKPDAQAGEMIVTGSIPHKPGRIAAQTAKQVVMQRLREAERDLVFDEYADKKGEVLTATIQRIESRFISVDLGRADAILPPQEQSQFERYRPGQQLKFYVVDVARTVRGPEIVVSRTHPDLLKRLFEMEVPEIFNGAVEIKAIAREPGSRSKVAVKSLQQGVDAIGACVGLRGIRIQNVVNELLGEKIDVIEWNDEPSRFISNSLSPAVVEKVSLDEESHTATVTVPDRQLSLAIGREGQNARLAAKLTNWRIDIQGATQLQQAAAPAVAAAVAEAVAPAPVAAAPVTAVEKPAPDANRGAEPQAAPSRPVREPAAQPRPGPAPATAGAGRLEEALALKQLEEELAVLEKQEAERRESEAAAAPVDVSSDDLWQMPAMGQPQQPGVLRFAEDIMSDRELSTGRRGSRGKRPGPKPKRPSRPGPGPSRPGPGR
jgi:N utilization substance protein A